jgi:hypothetical protein
MTCRQIVLIAFLTVPSSASNLAIAVAQSAPKAAPKIEYYYEVVGASTLAPNVARVWSEPYDSEAEATNRLNQILREHAPGGDLATDPEKPIKLKVVKKPKAAKDVKEAKSAVDKAKDLLEGKERQASDTLKEYKERIQVAWDNVTKTKKALTQQTQAITAAQLKNVNDQISQYNSSRDQLSAKFAVESRPYLKQYSALPKVTANDFGKKKDPDRAPKQDDDTAKKKTDDITGDWWDQRTGGTRLTLNPDNTLSDYYSNGRVASTGTWTNRGGQITIKVNKTAGTSSTTFTGKFDGTKLIGTWQVDGAPKRNGDTWDSTYSRTKMNSR